MSTAQNEAPAGRILTSLLKVNWDMRRWKRCESERSRRRGDGPSPRRLPVIAHRGCLGDSFRRVGILAAARTIRGVAAWPS